MEGLFDVRTILWHVANAAILFVALYFLLYKPVSRFLKKRADGVKAQLDDAERKDKEADARLAESQDALHEAQQKALHAETEGEAQARERAQEILAEAQRQADEIVRRAGEEAENIRKNAHEAMVEESASWRC